MGLSEVSLVPRGCWAGCPLSCLESSSVEDGDSGLLGWGSSYINFVNFILSHGELASQGFTFWVLLLLLLFNSSEAASSLDRMSSTLFFQKPSYTGVAWVIISPIFVRGFSELSLRIPRACFISPLYFCLTAACRSES